MIVISYKPPPKTNTPTPAPGDWGYEYWLANKDKKKDVTVIEGKRLDFSNHAHPDFSKVNLKEHKSNGMYINIDGDVFEYEAGSTVIKSNAPEMTAEQTAAMKKYFELEKKYGITDDDGVVIREYVGEEIYELTGTIFQANLDDFIYAAHGRAEGLTYSSCKSIFDIESYADKLLKFANRDMYGNEGRADKLTQEERKSLTNELYAIFDELAESIKQGKQLKVSELKGTFTLNGHKLTFADLFHVMDLCNATAEIHGGGYGHSTLGTLGCSMRDAYFITYAKNNLEGEARAFALDFQQRCLNDNYEKYATAPDIFPARPGTEYYSNYAIFKGSYREDLHNLFMNVDTSSEEAFISSTKDAIDKAFDLKYKVMKMRGAWDSFAKQVAQTDRDFNNIALSRIVAFKDVKTEWRW